MIKTKRNIFLIFIPLLVCNILIKNHGYANTPQQKLKGKPLLKNYKSEEMKTDPQNWAVIEDKRGVMYFGSSDGIVEYDGSSWRLIRTSNNSTCRSLDMDSTGRIYVGAVGELGFLEADSTGKLAYKSLVPKINKKDQLFKDVWNTQVNSQGAFFASGQKIFRYYNNKIHTYSFSSNINTLFKINNKIYTHEWDNGLMLFSKDSFNLVKGGKKLAKKAIYSIIAFDKNKYLLSSLFNGLFIYNKKTGESAPFNTDTDKLFKEYGIYQLINLDNDEIAISSLYNGIIIINKKGKLIDIINKKNGLQNNLTRHTYLDKRKEVLWCALNNGISMIEYNFPLRSWDDDLGLSEAVYDMCIHKNKNNKEEHWISTAAHVYKMENGIPKMIKGISSQCWEIISYQPPGKASPILLTGTNNGLYKIENNNAKQIIESRNAFTIHPSAKNKSIIYVGTIDGLLTIEYKNNNWYNKGITNGTNYELRSIHEDNENNLWIATRYNGILKIKNGEITKYDTTHGLPGIDLIAFFTFNNSLWFGTNDGLYTYNKTNNHFIKDKRFGKNLEVSSMIKQDLNGDLWIRRSNNKLDIYKMQPDSSFIKDTLSLKRMEAFLTYYPMLIEDTSKIWIGGRRELFFLNAKKLQNNKKPYQTLIRKTLTNDSILYWGYKNPNKKLPGPQLNYKNNNIRFNYSATYYIMPGAIQYSFKLTGYNNKWSDWSVENYKEFTNLHEGNYTMQVKAKNLYGVISSEASYPFSILPPWYRSILAYIIYILSLILFIWLIVYINSKRLKFQNLLLENTVKERTHDLYEANTELEEKQIELELQKEEITSQRDSIEIQNKELEKHRNHLDKLVKERTIELEKAKRKAEESDRLKSSFLANMSHEIRTPMNAIIGFSSLINDPELTTDGREELSILIEHNSNTLLHLIENIIDIAKIESGQIEIFKTKFNLNDTLKDIYINYKNTNPFTNKKINFTLKTEEKHNKLLIQSDPKRLEQVLGNLLNNAFKFTEKGQIDLGYLMNEKGNQISFYVKDTGIGLSENKKKIIFSRFTKIEDDRTKLYRGAGLGLAISKNIVELLGGKIWVESTPGKGSTFYFTILKK